MPLRERIESSVAAYRDQECLVLPDATLSFGEVDRLANASAGALLERGVCEGSVAMTLCHNGSALVATWFACMKIGAVFAPLNAALSGDPLAHVMSKADGRVLVCDGALVGAARAALRTLTNPPAMLVTGPECP
jgi:fatty-acyl-CoA synthase